MPAFAHIFLEKPQICAFTDVLGKEVNQLSSGRVHWPGACDSPTGEQGGEPSVLPLVLLLHVCIVRKTREQSDDCNNHTWSKTKHQKKIN